MRDLIWTLIGIWVLYQLSQAFGLFRSGQKSGNSQKIKEPAPKKQPGKKHAEGLGEYVDFEEIKD